MLQLSGKVARHAYRNLVLPPDIAAAAGLNAELSKIFNRFAIAGAAPLPHAAVAYGAFDQLRERGDDDDFESEVRIDLLTLLAAGCYCYE
jgi:hypothetical protein